MPRHKFSNITVSGLPGAGSSTLGRALAGKLKWEYFSGGDFMRAFAIEQGLFDKKSNFHHDATVYGEDFDRKVDFGMRERLKEKSERIYDSWLSGFMAQNVSGVLKILVVCSDDAVRVDRIMNRDGVELTDAKKHIFDREKKNREKWTAMYSEQWKKWVVRTGRLTSSDQIDFWNPSLYDLVIDTFSNSREETLQIVLDELS